jgi:diguanylate cyclase (GGDEF)-like protein
MHDAEDRPKSADPRGDRPTAHEQRGGVDDSVLVRSAYAKARGHAVGSSPGAARREEQTLRAVQDRRQAAADRTRAANDRSSATEERTRSAYDRAAAAQDRAQAALSREASETDELTHVRRRDSGMKQLEREIDRAHRTSAELVVTLIDVDGLKTVNDTEGHLAGDSLLVTVADSLRKRLRSYDLVMRYRGDEFVCALPNADANCVRRRFADMMSSALAADPAKGSITVGCAEFDDNDTAEELIRRADADLLAHREHR